MSDNGVFSKNKIDFGSRILIETFLKQKDEFPQTILDVGCGYGFLGIVAGYFKDCSVDLCDINKRALHLAQKNIEKNKVRGTTYLSNGYESITKKYDVILTNPPIRAGKKIVLEILTKAKEHLLNHGTLWFVINKDQGAKSIQKELEKIAKIEIMEKSKGFYIFRTKFS